MPSNWSQLKTDLNVYFESYSARDYVSAANYITAVYSKATIGQSSTVFGNVLLSADSDSLKRSLVNAFSYGYTVGLSEKYAGVLNISKIISNGLYRYWLSSQFSPFPPNPPTILPTTGVTVLYSGNPNICVPHLNRAMLSYNRTVFVNMFVLASVMLTQTISGVYNGLIPNPALIGPPVPYPPIPWVGVI